ncbi:hypothetical protein PI125_g25344 [Phytophthora idaei]|nr:hypothetical protein PI125_g25344 [Phytophthora idaei]
MPSVPSSQGHMPPPRSDDHTPHSPLDNAPSHGAPSTQTVFDPNTSEAPAPRAIPTLFVVDCHPEHRRRRDPHTMSSKLLQQGSGLTQAKGIALVVEHSLHKQKVRGSIPSMMGYTTSADAA